MIIDEATHQLHCKLVYSGPGMAGKTTNLQYLHWQIPEADRSALRSIASETERTLLFDTCLPAFADHRGFAVRFHVYTVPGCVLYEHTRRNLLVGADGVVFVADSQKHKLGENLKKLNEVVTYLTQRGTLDQFPLVLQYNKRDVPDILAADRLDRHMQYLNWPRFLATAVEGSGVMETFQAICGAVYARLDLAQASPQHDGPAPQEASVGSVDLASIASDSPWARWLAAVRAYIHRD